MSRVPPISDWRFDPFTETYNAVSVTNEDQVVPSSSPYRIRLYEVPREDNPSTVIPVILVELDEDLDNSEIAVDILAAHYGRVDVGDVLLCDDEQMYVSAKPGSPTLTVTRGYGGTTPDTHSDGTKMEILDSLTEITSGSPASREFRVDYDYNTGLVLFNAAQSGYDVRFDYYGLGAPFYIGLLGAANPLPLVPADFAPSQDSLDREISETRLFARASLSPRNYYDPVCLPQEAKITKITLYGYRDDAAASLYITLKRANRSNNSVTMAQAVLSGTGGYENVSDTTIDYDDIDNLNYGYTMALHIAPNDAYTDVQFLAALIYWE